MKYALLGAAGAVGKELGKVLAARGEMFRVVGRNLTELKTAFGSYGPLVDYHVADLLDPEAAAQAMSGIDTVFYLVGVPYHRFELHPRISEIVVNSAAKSGVRHFIHLSTLYSYGLMTSSRITEGHPRDPHTYKGRMRKEQEDIVLAAHGKNGMNVTILCPPDFYGGDSSLSLVHRVFEGALLNKPADVIGPIDLPHEFVYVPDLALTLFQLSQKEEAYGRRWNLGGYGYITVRDFAKKIYAETGAQLRLRVAGKWLLRILGLKDVFMREFVEMHYLMSKPIFVDDSNLKKLIPELQKTSYDEGIRKTLEFMKKLKAT